MNRSVAEAVEVLSAAVPDPTVGLPDEVFYYISRTTPLINVDLLIKDELGRTLLAWRNDPHAGTGWHIPGGIIRFKETAAERVRQVARSEIGAMVDFDREPIAINEMIHRERALRGHFISLLFNCRLDSSFVPTNQGLAPRDAGYLAWHTGCPDDIIAFHEVYRKYM